MTLSTRHRIQNSSPGGLRPSTPRPQYWVSHVDGEETFSFFQTAETGNRTPNAWKAAMLTTTLGLPPWCVLTPLKGPKMSTPFQRCSHKHIHGCCWNIADSDKTIIDLITCYRVWDITVQRKLCTSLCWCNLWPKPQVVLCVSSVSNLSLFRAGKTQQYITFFIWPLHSKPGMDLLLTK